TRHSCENDERRAEPSSRYAERMAKCGSSSRSPRSSVVSPLRTRRDSHERTDLRALAQATHAEPAITPLPSGACCVRKTATSSPAHCGPPRGLALLVRSCALLAEPSLESARIERSNQLGSDERSTSEWHTGSCISFRVGRGSNMRRRSRPYIRPAVFLPA